MIEYKGITINKNMSFGQRCLDRTPLTDKEIKWLKEEIRAIEADESKFIFNDEEHIHKSTCYDIGEDVIYVTRNVFPDEKSDSIHPRDRMSPRAVLAHEYYGHRPQRERYLREMAKEVDEMPAWEDEKNASLDAAENTPNLDKRDIQLLIEDAKMRLLESGHIFEYTDKIKEKLYGNYNSSEQSYDNEKKIVPCFGEQSRRRNEKNRNCYNSLPRM